MKTIEYRVSYTGVVVNADVTDETLATRVERIRVQARDINSGYSKALKLAKVPLGNGSVREIGSIEFWEVV